MNNKSTRKFWIKWGERFSSFAQVVAAATLSLLSLSTASAQSVQPIYSFPASPAGPNAGVVEGPDGNFYGTTIGGGASGEGTVFKATTNGVVTMLYSFSPPFGYDGTYVSNSDGVQPLAGLALGPNGNFYGTTSKGGTNGDGTVFEITTNGALTTLVTFTRTNGAYPEAGLAVGPDGNLYGTTSQGGSNGNGLVFQVTTNGVVTPLHSFSALINDLATGSVTNADGAAPYAGLALGTNGIFYGAAASGGVGGSGTLFEVTTNGAWTNLYSFSAENYNESGAGEPDTNLDGADPVAAMTLGSDGNFYGTTRGGGKSGIGTVFKLTSNGALTTLYTFSTGHLIFNGERELYTNSDGAFPFAALAPGPNGYLYGTTSEGGRMGLGTLFEVTTGSALMPLVVFTNANGANPGGTLALDANGNFYGTTYGGGSGGEGTVFGVTTSGVLTTLADFAENNGAVPYAGLALAPNGNFYGTTYGGGSNSDGTVFEITTNGVLTTLVNFAGTNGSEPEASLALGPNGNFYGTTYSGGSNNLGTVFEVTTNGALTTLASFGGTNGWNPEAGLTLGTNGNFYGTTVNGGADGAGTVFEVTSNGVLATLYSFTGGNDGAEPEAGLTGGTNGIFYGITSFGGSGGYGTVFAMMASGGLTTLYTFKDGDDGAGSFAALTSGLNGNFYGTTAGDEDSTYGNVFEVTPGGALTNLYSFTNGNDSASPDAALTLGPDDNFYGTTYGNFSGTPFDSGSNPWGTVFEAPSNGAFATLLSFAGTNGENSKGNLVLGPDGNFYGTTSYGGTNGIGEVYRLNLPPEILQQPASQPAFPGTSITLSVTLFGTTPYSFQWLSNDIAIVGATNGMLTIPDFAIGDAANYSVMVSNAWGSAASAVASVTAETAPVISNITMPANGNPTLNCQSQPNVTSRLWATTNLAVQAAWTAIFTNSVTSPGGAWQFTDTNGLDQQKYYRISTP